MTKKQNRPEELDAIDEDLLAAIARIKGHPVQKAVPQPVSVLYPVTAAETARIKAEKEAWKNPAPGQRMPDGTIFVGKYSPKDRFGRSLCLEFNVFAAKEDLPGGVRTYVDTIKHVAELKNWNGYDGERYADDKKLYEALKEGTYKGGWIIPTRDILQGKDIYGVKATPDNICAHKKKGAFRDTFKRGGDSGNAHPASYWSCTKDRGAPDYTYGICLTDGYVDWDLQDKSRLSCRPVRLVPCK